MKKFFILSFLLVFSLLSYAQDCSIADLTVVANECDGDFFSVTIDFALENDDSENFVVVGNGTNYGTFLIENLPITIGTLLGDDIVNYEFGVYIPGNTECQSFVELGPISCGPICEIANAELEFISCQSNITALVELNFDFTNVEGNAFDLFYTNGNAIGSYLYDDLPVVLTNLVVSGNEPILLTICDDDSECCTDFEFPAIDCNPNNCEIFNLIAEPTCDGDVFYVDIDFDFDNPGNSGFVVTGNGVNYGSFSYVDLPITLGPLNGSTNLEWEFVIADSTNSNCSSFVDLGQINCPMNCEITELIVEVLECSSNSTYGIEIDATVLNPESSSFTLFTNGSVLGSYNYEALPLTISDFPGSGEFQDIITLCDNEDSECCQTITFDALLCAGCVIYNAVAEPQPCTENETFDIIIDFDHQNEGTQGFQIGGNGNIYGQFDYGDLPITLGPFEADGSTFYEFLILDLENFGCLAAIELGTITCNDICSVSDLIVTELECSGADQYSLLANFNFSGGLESGFDVFANEVLIGFYSGNDLPLSIQNFPASGNKTESITICHNDLEDCCQTITFSALNCALPCTISDLVIDDVSCLSDTSLTLFVDFNYAQTDGNLFDIYGNEVFLGSFEKDSGFIAIENFPISITDFQIIQICANDMEMCCESLQFVAPNCASDTCAIRDLETTNVFCDSDTTLQVNFQFIYENANSNLFDVFCDTTFLGSYEKSGDAPIEIDGILINNVEEKIFTICANDLPECCSEITVEVPNCAIDLCDIRDLDVVSIICDSDSTFQATIQFIHENTEGNLFDIYCDTMLIATVEKSGEDPIVVPGISTNDTGEKTITICANDLPDCCDQITVITPNCQPDSCSIEIVSLIPVECISDTTFRLNVNMMTQNVGTQFFDVYSQGDFVGFFEVVGNTFSVQNFPTSTGEFNEIVICRSDDLVCCDTVVFEGLVCDPELCLISDIMVSTSDCSSDSTFTVELDFNFQNTGSDTFDLFGMDGYITTIVKGDSSIVLEGFAANTLGEYVISICATDVNGCCADRFFDGPVCTAECIIYDLDIRDIECVSPFEYNALLDFQYLNLSGNAFHVSINNSFLGTYTFDSLAFDTSAIMISNIPFTGADVVELTVCDTTSEMCCQTIEFEPPNCSELFCMISDLEFELSDCDTSQTFFVTLDFLVTGPGDLGFSVRGNGTNYGNFSYASVPITIGPLLADTLIEYEFLVVDLETEACFDFVDVGVVNCEPVGTSSVEEIKPAAIYYVDGQPYIDIVHNQTTIEIFQYDGKLLRSVKWLENGRKVALGEYVDYHAVYILKLTDEKGVSVGKFVR